MPRGAGVGNADTIQQRARFFGYKKAYHDLCHAWMSSDLAQSYRDYVDHEQHLRKEMQQAQADGINLKKWTRKMLLDSSMKATRRAVIKLPDPAQQVPWGFMDRG
ncbi:Z1 domain-containing protein [Aeromicrobium sp. UC242_57]|uniref:Z1 domain-containing protein n=1 Tax=Aeromicrobium sp. UC242_57 TaxID=3374624 RepID=UPI0037938D44